MSFLVKVKEIYKKYITNKTISNHQLATSIVCFLPIAGVLAHRVGGAPGEGHGSGSSLSFSFLSLSLSLFFAYAQQQLQTWLKSQWIPEKARIKHDKKILKITTS